MSETITITDNRTNESVEIPILNKSVTSRDWAKLLPGIWFYDPGLATTAVTQSSIAEINGNEGMLRYRGYPIEQLGDKCSYPEVAYLLLYGELPDADQLSVWRAELADRSVIDETYLSNLMNAFPQDAHPMAMLASSVAALSMLYPESRDVENPENRMIQTARLIAKMPTLAAAIHRRRTGQAYIPPNADISFVPNFLHMMFQEEGKDYECHPVIAKAMDVLFTLHADHGQNCSTTAARVVGSSHADPYSAVTAACSALYGPRHGGANEAVLKMLAEIESLENVDALFAGESKYRALVASGLGHRHF